MLAVLSRYLVLGGCLRTGEKINAARPRENRDNRVLKLRSTGISRSQGKFFDDDKSRDKDRLVTRAVRRALNRTDNRASAIGCRLTGKSL